MGRRRERPGRCDGAALVVGEAVVVQSHELPLLFEPFEAGDHSRGGVLVELLLGVDERAFHFIQVGVIAVDAGVEFLEIDGDA